MYPWCSKKCNTEVSFYRNLKTAICVQTAHCWDNVNKGKQV